MPGIYQSQDTLTNQYLNLVHVYMFVLTNMFIFPLLPGSIQREIQTGRGMIGFDLIRMSRYDLDIQTNWGVCNAVSLCRTLGTLGFNIHREYIDFPFCGILDQTMKVKGQGWQDPFDVARKQ